MYTVAWRQDIMDILVTFFKNFTKEMKEFYRENLKILLGWILIKHELFIRKVI